MIRRAARRGIQTTRRSIRAIADLARAGRTRWLRWRLNELSIRQVNLCSGTQRVSGWFAIDVLPGCDLRLDLRRYDLPFDDGSLHAIVCMSAINYFPRTRGTHLAREMYRVLQQGGVCRVGVQDMHALARRYVNGDREFFFEKLPDGRDRLEGPTIGDKFAAWFYGYAIGASRCEYFYDYESLEYLFREAGFSTIERRSYRDSRLPDARQLDNRPEHMFFLEAVK